jgi:hypothetical protein
MFVDAAELMGASDGLGFLRMDTEQTGRPERVLAAIQPSQLGPGAERLAPVLPRLQQQHAPLRILGQTRRQHRPGGAAADHDHVPLPIHITPRQRRSPSCMPTTSRKRTFLTVSARLAGMGAANQRGPP